MWKEAWDEVPSFGLTQPWMLLHLSSQSINLFFPENILCVCVRARVHAHAVS